MTLIELAQITWEEYQAYAAEDSSKEFAQAREEFLQAARSTAARTLCADAEKLAWQYTPGKQLPEQAEQATALLEPGRPEYLRFRVDHGAETVTFDLVRPCQACGIDRVDEVHGLVDLGRLLAEGSDR
ncbi:hypothetical protein [Streptomyces anandii]|uniref:hypothetical protein n=1 Tax=Streptomyces anandii TaxID=285454 RepID=UPI0037A5CA2E